MSTRRPAPRTLFALPAGIALLVGVDAGLSLLDAWPPVDSGRLGEVHGIVMVLGFVGTLIALERAVALGRPVGYAAPALLGLGALLLVPESTGAIGAFLITAGALALCLLYVPLWQRNRDDAVLVSALGAVCALGGALLWRGGAETSQTIPWLAGFVILTIGGERLELARLAMPPTAGRDLVLLSSVLASAVVAATLWPTVGTPALGLALLALTAWLVRHDVARRTVNGSGLPRFAAVCIGFTISMIMAHASSILPAVTRVPLPYRSVMYVPWALLQLSLVLRLWGGDALGNEMARRVGGAGNAIALLLFLLVAIGSTVRGAPPRPARPARTVEQAVTT